MLFKDMSDADLGRAYVDNRNLSADWSNLAGAVAPKSKGGRIVGRGWGRALRNVDIIEAIARKRGIAIRDLIALAKEPA